MLQFQFLELIEEVKPFVDRAALDRFGWAPVHYIVGTESPREYSQWVRDRRVITMETSSACHASASEKKKKIFNL